MRFFAVAALGVATALGPAAATMEGQVIRGRVIEPGTDRPVPLAGVFLLDATREPAATTLADTLGRYVIEAPEPGEYYILVQRLGYFETESPLIAMGESGEYALDFEARAEPIRLDPLMVTVRNEEMERWYTRAFGVNPNTVLGFRAIQGARLEEARLQSDDSTELLRNLWVPVSHAIDPCLGSRMRKADRRTMELLDPECGRLWVDGREMPVEHLGTIDHSTVALVVLIGPNVELFTFGFDWSAQPSRTRLSRWQ